MERQFGDWFVTDIVTGTIERFREVRRRSGCGVVGVNRNLALLRAAFNWGIRKGYIDATPFLRGGRSVVKLSKEIARARRLRPAEGDSPGEEEALLAASGPYLHAVIIAALETGMRRGELLSLQWNQIRRRPKAEIVLPASKTKARKDRCIPASSRMKALLEMRRLDPSGQEYPPTAYVFGNEVGDRVVNFRQAWESAVLKAHGYPAVWKQGKLTAQSRQYLKAIDLHFHDLRREAGSQWLEGGVPLQTVRDWLGHTNVAQTSTYLATTLQGHHDAMARFEQTRARGAGKAPVRPAPSDDAVLASIH